MKRLFLFGIFLLVQNFLLSQKNFLDQSFLETRSEADTLVIPDRIYMHIAINEAYSKNKKSVEEQEQLMEATLKKLNIDTQKNLSLLDISSDFKNYFLKGQNILKIKQYSLLVRNAVIAGKVLAELEAIGISNVRVKKVEYSNKENVLLNLKVKAVEKTRKTAQKLVQPLEQKVGKAVYISDSHYEYDDFDVMESASEYKVATIQNAVSEPISVDFHKIKLRVEVKVRYIIE